MTLEAVIFLWSVVIILDMLEVFYNVFTPWRLGLVWFFFFTAMNPNSFLILKQKFNAYGCQDNKIPRRDQFSITANICFLSLFAVIVENL